MKVRADRFLIASASVTCPACEATTSVLSLVLPPGHETDEADDVEEFGGWAMSDHYAFLFFVEQITRKARDLMQEVAPQYREPSSVEENSSGFRNHCTRCSVVFDDQDLVCEPGGAFLPTSEAEAALISLCTIDHVIEASIAGYAYQPEFFEAMIQE